METITAIYKLAVQALIVVIAENWAFPEGVCILGLSLTIRLAD